MLARPAGRPGNLATSHGLGAQFDLQSLDELVKEQGYTVGNRGLGHFARVSLSNLELAPVDQVGAVRCEEFV